MSFVARFGFFIASFLLFFVAFRCPLLLLLVFQCSRCQPPCIGPELKQMNENGNEKCSLLLLLVFRVCFHLASVAFCCSSLLVLVFEMESVLSQKPKQANAFGCSFWLLVARFGFL